VNFSIVRMMVITARAASRASVAAEDTFFF
jgi:hypothetical protein